MTESKINIVVDGAIFHRQSHGGISRIYQEVLPRIVDLESSIHVDLLMYGHPRQGLPNHPRIEIHRLPIETWIRPRRVLTPIFNLVKTAHQHAMIDRRARRIWHSTYYTRPLSFNGPKVLLVPDMLHEIFPELFTTREEREFRAIKRRCILEADAVLCISQTTREDVLRFNPELDPERVSIVPLAHSKSFRPLPERPAKEVASRQKPFILTFGSINAYKGFDTAVRAYRKWGRRHDIELAVVGGGFTEDEIRKLRSPEENGTVQLLKPVDDEELRALYTSAEAFLFPSLYEGFGIPLLESMACGCPVVASRIPATIEVAGEVPTYFEPGDHSSLIDALEVVIGSGRHNPAIEQGMAHARRFSWDETARIILGTYMRLLG
ncbi:MAG: glycosyltransferase family 4 protein [Myxococcota bacterium]